MIVHQQTLSPIVGEHLVDVVIAEDQDILNPDAISGQVLLHHQADDQGDLMDQDEGGPELDVRREPAEDDGLNSDTDSNQEDPEMALTEFLYDYNNHNISDIKGK